MNAPVLFISHGAPDLVISDIPAHHALKQLGEQLRNSESPYQGVLILSAHWYTDAKSPLDLELESSLAPETVYDFAGFSPQLYRYRYTAHSSSALQNRVKHQIELAGGKLNPRRRGLDHGSWVPLSLIDPEATLPVASLSLPATNDPQQMVKLGRALTALRDQGIIILASGAITHNLWHMGPNGTEPPGWATRFTQFMQQALAEADREKLLSAISHPDFAIAHPTAEHFLPLYVALGASDFTPAKLLHHSFSYQSIAMDC